MEKITIAAGHGLGTSGKETPNGVKEWKFNDQVVRAFMNKMSHYENVALLRLDDPTGKRDIPLKERSERANSWGATLHIDFHHNAFNGKWHDGGGIETFVMEPTASYKRTGHYEPSMELAKLVHPRYVKAMGLVDRGIKTKNLHMLRELKCPAILTEGGFMDSNKDIIAMNNPVKLKAQGEAIADGVIAFLKLKKRGDSKMDNKVENIELTDNQKKALDKMVAQKLMTKGFEFPNNATGQALLTMVTILAPMIDQLKAKGSI